MADKWMSIQDAILRLKEAGLLKENEAIGPMAMLVLDRVLETRITKALNGLTDVPRRDVAMSRDDWETIFELESDQWFSDGKVSFDDDNEWLGIQVHEGDVKACIASWTRGLSTQTGQTTSVADKPNKRRARPRGTGYHKTDAPLVERMHELLLADSSLNHTSAATKVLKDAPSGSVPGASDEAKVDRLVRRYNETHGVKNRE